MYQLAHDTRRCYLLVATTALFLTGCGEGEIGEQSHEKVYPVQGTVLYNGTPVAGATVSFQSTGTGQARGASGMTNDAGEFELTTFAPGDGAIAGSHKVSVLKSVVEGADTSYFDVNSPNYGKTPPPGAAGKTKYLVPEKYSQFDTSGLTVNVNDSGDNAIQLELKD
tara:strand:- start:148208 stop:148708 length:501 start_codon:yes stop_codon:yes gene_type:complete